MLKRDHLLAGILFLLALAGCGGGGSGDPFAVPPIAVTPPSISSPGVAPTLTPFPSPIRGL